MNSVILLDSGPPGMVSNPKGLEQSIACTKWMRSLLAREARVILPEIADYEVRRELIRANKRRGVQRLDELKALLEYAPITTEVMLQAAAFWATARRRGQPTAPDPALDGDVILAAQASVLAREGVPVVIVTTHAQHLSRFVGASHWTDID